MSPRACEKRVALLEQRTGAHVVACREREVAEVVDRERRDSRVPDLPREGDGLLEHDGRARRGRRPRGRSRRDCSARSRRIAARRSRRAASSAASAKLVAAGVVALEQRDRARRGQRTSPQERRLVACRRPEPRRAAAAPPRDARGRTRSGSAPPTSRSWSSLLPGCLGDTPAPSGGCRARPRASRTSGPVGLRSAPAPRPRQAQCTTPRAAAPCPRRPTSRRRSAAYSRIVSSRPNRGSPL